MATDTPEKTEAEVLVPEPLTVTLVDGSVFTLPPTSWGKEIRILRVIKDVMVEVVQSGIFNPQLDEEGNPLPVTDSEATSKILTLLFGTAPEKLTEAVSALTGQKAEWVQEKFNIELIIQVIVPFLAAKQDSIRKVVEGFLPVQIRKVISPEENPILN